MKPHILFIRGLSDQGEATIQRIDSRTGRLDYKFYGNTDIYKYLSDEEALSAQSWIFDTRPEFEVYFQAAPQLFFNEIANPDTNQIALKKMQLLCQAYPQIPCINPPDLIFQTTRDQVAQRLQEISQVNMPLTFRFRPTSPQDIIKEVTSSALAFPVIMRECGSHQGNTTYRIDNVAAAKNFYLLPLDGRPYYLTQYIDYQQEGVYQLYRLIVVGGEVFLKHFRVHEDWLIHRKRCEEFMRKHPRYQALETYTFEKFAGPLRQVFQALVSPIYQRLPLDVFGVDCALMPDGTLLIFEVNICMNVFYLGTEPPPEQISSREEIKSALIHWIHCRAQETQAITQ